MLDNSGQNVSRIFDENGSLLPSAEHNSTNTLAESVQNSVLTEAVSNENIEDIYSLMADLLSKQKETKGTFKVDEFLQKNSANQSNDGHFSFLNYLYDWLQLNDLEQWARPRNLHQVVKLCDEHKKHIEALTLNQRATTLSNIAVKLLICSDKHEHPRNTDETDQFRRSVLCSIFSDLQKIYEPCKSTPES